MNEIEQFLKTKNARLSYERRWLIYDDLLDQWEVYGQPYYERVSLLRAFPAERIGAALECLDTGIAK